ncbi:DNA helicase, partial [Tanacetum coccineum]
KQTALAISTIEAEYVSARKACQQALWMKQSLVDYGIRLDDIPIMCDNKRAIDLSAAMTDLELDGYNNTIDLSYFNSARFDFGLRLPPEDLMAVLRNKLLMEEKSYNRELLAREKDTLLRKLKEKQRQIFDLIINACTNNRQELIFVYGHGGTADENMDETQQKGVHSQLVAGHRSGFIWGFPDECDHLRNTFWVEIPNIYRIPDDENGITNLIKFIYDDDTLRYPTPQKLQEKVIVCPKNEIVDIINAKVMSTIAGRAHIYRSYDEALHYRHEEETVEKGEESLNSGWLVQGDGLLFNQLLPKVIEAQIIGNFKGEFEAYLKEKVNCVNIIFNLRLYFCHKRVLIRPDDLDHDGADHLIGRLEVFGGIIEIMNQ